MIRDSTPETFLHFYGNWIIAGMRVIADDGGVTLQVRLRDEVPTELAFGQHPGAGLFQINRLAAAAGALSVSGRPLLDLVAVELTLPVPGLAGRQRLPLRAFTRREKFNAGGPNGLFCEQSCGLVPFLTSSAEPCLDAANRAIRCPTGLETILPFADLTYRGETPKVRRHTVVAGDTLFALATRYLGDGSRYALLAQANGITDADYIQIGQVIDIP